MRWLALLALSASPALASYYFSPDTPMTLGGTTWLPSEVVFRSDAGVYSLSVALPAGTRIDAIHRMETGDLLFSVEKPTLLGGVSCDPRDVVRYDGTSYSLFFGGAAAGIPFGHNVDSAFLNGGDSGDLILSFDIPTTLGGVTYEPSDLVRYSSGVFSIFFDASLALPPVPIRANVTGADRRGTRTILTFDVPTRLGGVTYLPGQIVAWNGTAFSSFALDPGWPPGRFVNALAMGSCLDADGDGFGVPGDGACAAGNREDCDDMNASVWGTPFEVPGDAVFSDATTLMWNPPPSLGATAVVYDTLRSSSPSDFTGGGTCLESNGADMVTFDPASPIVVGSAYFYLIRAENGCPGPASMGSLGTTSGGVPRAGLACP